jgi:hypothetical protein
MGAEAAKTYTPALPNGVSCFDSRITRQQPLIVFYIWNPTHYQNL